MKKTAISLTKCAAEHVKSFLEKQDISDYRLRVAVKPTGCSGYQYIVERAGQATDNDAVFESNGITIFTDKQSLKYLAGCELDFVYEGVKSGFKFNNPNVQRVCGCGESFSVKEAGADR